ncbi:MAG: hypothetical protein M1371_09795 [Actinobacteria bacterium]|nr:hypothetical protein [Actinomycetota bacterium]MCL5986834.1 hypothetical protein [Actinomycetota bacterium]
MRQFTVRGLSKELEERIEKEVNEKGLSLNKVLMSLLEKGSGLSRIKRSQVIYSDLDHLAGSWSLEEAQEIEKYIKDQRKIDEDMWK